MGVVGMVHGYDIGDQRRVADEPGKVRHRADPTRRLDQERRMGDIADPDGVIGQRIAKACLLQISEAGRGVSNGDAMAGTDLSQRWMCQKKQNGKKESQHKAMIPQVGRLPFNPRPCVHVDRCAAPRKARGCASGRRFEDSFGRRLRI